MNRLQNEPMYKVDSTEGETITDLTSVSKVFNNFIYKSQLKKRTSTPIASQEKWLRDPQVENVSDIDWNEIYNRLQLYGINQEPFILSSYCIGAMIATDDFLKKISSKQCYKCCFCRREIETICHLFLRCCATNVFGNDVKQFLIQKRHKSNVVLTDLHLIGLYKVATPTTIDLVLLFGRYHIYSSKLTGSSHCISVFKGKLNSVIEIERQEAPRCNSLTAFSNKWKLFLI